MSESKAKNALIVKNTLFMYARMLVMLFVSLFTARIVYNTLGIEGYGTYGLVSGIIIFFTFINNALSTATKRFVTAEIGKKNNDNQIRHVFNICIQAHIVIALLVLLLAETIGLWFINNKLNVPPELINGANWTYQFSVISAVLGIIQSPYGAVIVAYEKMNIYAAFTILDIVFKLLIIYAVQAVSGDKLIIYSSLVFAVAIINMIIYRVYTSIKMPVCRLKMVKDKKLLKEVFSFTSWSLFGQAAVVGTNQGVSVLVNIFYSVTVNAAMGISNTIVNTVNGFVTNFQVAFNPQIIKSHYSGDFSYLHSLLVRSSKLSSYLIIIFLVPLLFEIPRVLTLWLGDYPEYAVEFCLLELACIYLEAIMGPLWMLAGSQSNIKTYQIVISLIYLLNLVGAWIVLSLGWPPYGVLIVKLFVLIISLFARLILVKKILRNLEINKWLYQVLLKGIIIILISCLVTSIAYYNIELPTFLHIIVITIVSLCCSIPLIYWLGMDQMEQRYINELMQQIRNYEK